MNAEEELCIQKALGIPHKNSVFNKLRVQGQAKGKVELYNTVQQKI